MNRTGLEKAYVKLQDEYRKRERLIVLIVATILIGGILLGTGNVFIQWNWVDDHETYRFLNSFSTQNVSLISFIRECIRNDMRARWRPLYWVIRATMPYLFGNHPPMFKVTIMIAGIATYVFLYWSARNLQCTACTSHLFAWLILVGRQYEAWYRVANQENWGIFFASVCLWLLTKQYKDNAFRWKTDLLIAVLVVCCALMKESFVLLPPAFVWLRVGLEAARNLHSPNDIIKIIKKNFLFIIALLLFFLANIYIIVTYVGVNQNGYAGLEEGYGIKDYIWALQRLCRDSLYVYVLLACVILGVTLLFLGLMFLFKRIKFDVDWILFVVLLLFGGYVVLTQMILHAKSGMWDRYLLPGIVGYAIIFIVCTDLVMKNAWYRIAAGFVVAVFLVGRLKLAIVDMSYLYAQEAKAINQVYDFIISQTEPNARIVDGFDNDEAEISFSVFMELKGRPHVYSYDYEEKLAEDVYGEYAKESIPLSDADVFVSWTEDEETSDALIKSYGDWDRIDIMGLYNVYIRK